MDFITVKVGKVPGGQNDYALNDGATVQDALNESHLSAEGFTITVGSDPAELNTVLEDGDRVILTQKIKGN